MNITFYKISDDRRAVTKTLNTSTKIVELTGNLKSDCSIMDPEIEVSYDPALMQANYMYIDDFQRFYFIDNITTSMQRLYIRGHVDVLYTYSAQIKNLDCIVERQENRSKSNLYLNDEIFRALNYKIISTLPFPSSPFMRSGGNVDSLILTVGGPY